MLLHPQPACLAGGLRYLNDRSPEALLGQRGGLALTSLSLSFLLPQVEPYQGQAKDDTALNGVQLYCTRGSHGEKSEAKTVESQSNV